MKKLTKQLLTGVLALGLLAPVATSNLNPVHTTVNARRRTKLSTWRGQTIKLTKPVRVHFIRMYSQPWKDHSIRSKVLRRGTVLHAWEKGTEGVDWCVYGKQARITRHIWPSMNLTNGNCRVLHQYKNRYNYTYTMKHVLHYHGDF